MKTKDKEAFTELICRYESSMYKTARAILGNDEDAADAIQDTVLVCWEKLGTLRSPDYFKTWMTRILINRCYDLLRLRKRIVSDEPLPERGREDDGYSRVEWQELLNVLEEKHRIVLVLYYAEGFKVREIAELLSLNENTVKDRLSGARKKYQEHFCK